MKKTAWIVWCCGALVWAGTVLADVLSTRTSNVAIQVGPGTASCAPLTTLQTVRFVTLRDNQRVVVAFTGECTVKSPDTISWLNIDLVIDGVEIPPTQTTDNALCTSQGTNTLDGWVGATTTGVFVVPEPGIHTLIVRASLINCNDATDDQWRVDDMATVIHSN